MAKLTISEALGWKKTLQERHAELVNLRNEDSYKEKRFYGTAGDKSTERTPTYDVKGVDKLITQVAKEIRLVDVAIKKANGTLEVPGYDQNEAVLGEVA